VWKNWDTWVCPLGIDGADVAALVGDLQTSVLLVELSRGVVVDGKMELPDTWMTERTKRFTTLAAVLR
jgi:hypothetical protein